MNVLYILYDIPHSCNVCDPLACTYATQLLSSGKAITPQNKNWWVRCSSLQFPVSSGPWLPFLTSLRWVCFSIIKVHFLGLMALYKCQRSNQTDSDTNASWLQEGKETAGHLSLHLAHGAATVLCRTGRLPFPYFVCIVLKQCRPLQWHSSADYLVSGGEGLLPHISLGSSLGSNV